MAIRFDCPNCGTHLSAGDDDEGKGRPCPKCKSLVMVPNPFEGIGEIGAEQRKTTTVIQNTIKGIRRSISQLAKGLLLSAAVLIGSGIVLVLVGGVSYSISENQQAWRAAVLVLLLATCILLGVIVRRLESDKRGK